MRKALVTGIGVTVLGAALLTGPVWAQYMPMHGAQMQHGQPTGSAPGGHPGVPTLPGQDAFGAIAEIVRLLEADPATDWSKVNLERLRQHLIDMNEVVLRSTVRPAVIPGGLMMEVTGTGRTAQAIPAMVVPHAVELSRMPEWSAKTELLAGGLRLTVTAKAPDDARAIARIRGLGFIGLLTVGAHHQPHHLAMAKGEEMEGHGH